MSWSLNLITAPATEPVTLAELKSQAHITYTAQDATLSAYIVAARQLAEGYLRRSLITQTWEISLDHYPSSDCVYLLRSPVISLTSITITDENGTETTLDNSDFILDNSSKPARLVLKSTASWPTTTLQAVNGIKIRYVTGYGDASKVPETYKHAIKLFASFADDNRAAETVDLPKAFWDLLTPSRIQINAPY